MNTTTEPPDPLTVRDLLTVEQSPDVVTTTIRQLAARGMSLAAILGELPTVSEGRIRDALALRASN